MHMEEPLTTGSATSKGKAALIGRLVKNFQPGWNSTLKGPGDDAAVLGYGGKSLVWTTDLLLEGVHFDLTYFPLKHLGYKAASVNFSDVYAMNAVPRQILVSLGVSAKMSPDRLEDLYEGLRIACEEHRVDLAGGDLTSSLTGLTISVTVLGEVEDQVVYRNTAREGDLLCVSGDLGSAYLGLQILEREKRLFQENKGFQPRLEGYDYVLQRQLRPAARKEIPALLKERGIRPTAMIDVSAGLSEDLQALCSASALGCKIYEHKIPIAAPAEAVASELNISPMVAAMNGGEDYELLFSVAVEDYPKLIGMEEISIIGHLVSPEEGLQIITSRDESMDLDEWKIL